MADVIVDMRNVDWPQFEKTARAPCGGYASSLRFSRPGLPLLDVGDLVQLKVRLPSNESFIIERFYIDVRSGDKWEKTEILRTLPTLLLKTRSPGLGWTAGADPESNRIFFDSTVQTGSNMWTPRDNDWYCARIFPPWSEITFQLQIATLEWASTGYVTWEMYLYRYPEADMPGLTEAEQLRLRQTLALANVKS